MDEMKRLLASIGKKSFVDFYENYQRLYLKGRNLTKEDKELFAKKLLESNPNASELRGQITRINAALRIFKHDWQKEALNEVITSTHKIITNDIKNRARELLKQG
nr:hypothetical protein [Neobacillus sp. Marseille-Q6967]